MIEGEASLVRLAEREQPATVGRRVGVRVRVGEEDLESPATTVILATGSVKRSIPGRRVRRRRDRHRGGLGAAELPARLTVVGAGASGAEIASGFARLGSEVKLFEVLDRLLPTEDADISRLVERGLKRQGIEVHTGTPVEGVSVGEAGVNFSYGSESAEVDYLVICAGRGSGRGRARS